MPNPHVRRRARERALQFLFGLDFTRYAWDSALDDFWTNNPSRVSVKEYATKLVRGVSENRDALDEAIIGALDRWSMDRVGAVERNVLRIALFEMRHCGDVPEKVAINEAIEVARNYGADDAPRFVNGVLDRLRKEVPSRQADS